MSCILEDQNKLNSFFDFARKTGSKIQPMIVVFCDGCNKRHVVNTPQNLVNNRPEIILTQQEKEANERWTPKTYCQNCASYHLSGMCQDPDRADKLGANIERGFDNWHGE